jgi:hypothetical protein
MNNTDRQLNPLRLYTLIIPIVFLLRLEREVDAGREGKQARKGRRGQGQGQEEGVERIFERSAVDSWDRYE